MSLVYQRGIGETGGEGPGEVIVLGRPGPVVEVLRVLGRIVGSPDQRGAVAVTATVAITSSVTVHNFLRIEMPSFDSLPKFPPPERLLLATLRWEAPSKVDGLDPPVPGEAHFRRERESMSWVRMMRGGSKEQS